MKSKNNTSIYVTIAIIFIIAFIFLAAKPLAKEYNFEPCWNVSISNPTVKDVGDKKTMYYRLGQTIGYITEDGEISLNKTFPSKVSISNNYYTIYNTNNDEIKFYDPKGKESGVFEAQGFPYFYKNLVYTFLPGGCSFVKCNENGKVEWKYEGTIPITAFNAKDKYTALGLANGTIKIFNNLNGNTEVSFTPGGSDLPVILGCDVSNDGKYIASLSGQNKQRFVLASRENNQLKILYHRFLDSDSPYQNLVYFCNDGNRIIYNYENKIGIYNITKDIDNEIPINKHIISIKESKDLIILLGKKDKEYTIYMIDKNNTLVGNFSFNSENAFINTDENSLYLGKDNRISKINLSIK
ncbi:MAG: hypothetical protein K5866_04750 [Treponema sp.]|nr:hypothetical protein [Treponema sp.]